MKIHHFIGILSVIILLSIIKPATSVPHYPNPNHLSSDCNISTIARLIDLRTQANLTLYNGPADLRSHSGPLVNNYTGCAVIGGDITGDQFAEITVEGGCMGIGNSDIQSEYGSSQLPTHIQLDGTEPANLTIRTDGYEAPGESFAVSDINHDGINDLIAGGQSAVVVFYGRNFGTPTVSLGLAQQDIQIYPPRTSWFVTAGGDINGDGFSDILVGALGSSSRGIVYVIYGRPFPSGTIIDLNTEPADLTIYGAADGDQLGNDLATGDLNHDGIADIIIGARKADGAKGRVHVIYGKRTFLPHQVIDLSTTTADITVLGESSGDEFGNSVFSNDVNGDGIADLLVGAREADSPGRINGGKAYVLFGRTGIPSNSLIDLSRQPVDITVIGEGPEFRLGSTVSSGDINGDGMGDLLIGSSSLTRSLTYVLYGQPNTLPPTIIDLAVTQANITAYDHYSLPSIDFSQPPPFDLGYPYFPFLSEPMSLSAADINGDGFDDVLIGNHVSEPFTPQSSRGNAYAIFGTGCPCNRLLDEKPGNNNGEWKHGCSPGTVHVGQEDIGWKK